MSYHDRKTPNRDRSKKIISFRLDQDPETQAYLDSLKRTGELSTYINKAIFFKRWYDSGRKGFLIDIVRNNYELVKYLVRKIGWAFSTPHK